ncbi:hypothetical protein BC937DRAFT_86986 [Endogone sp. FLAS-F59071]|nr:hypothetical protein BC937DRAFT_86986 [Endogone sp. FLAS-F59071]|eukprot:RUS22779.1 hypothetical protein BC937DRAFT_86986 [Endogone sp. FLAS-F59071]
MVVNNNSAISDRLELLRCTTIYVIYVNFLRDPRLLSFCVAISKPDGRWIPAFSPPWPAHSSRRHSLASTHSAQATLFTDIWPNDLHFPSIQNIARSFDSSVYLFPTISRTTVIIKKKVTHLVDPFIGTIGEETDANATNNKMVSSNKQTNVSYHKSLFISHRRTQGHVFPGPSLPHGIAKVGIDIPHSQAGYNIEGNVFGISHMHSSGTGGSNSYQVLNLGEFERLFERQWKSRLNINLLYNTFQVISTLPLAGPLTFDPVKNFNTFRSAERASVNFFGTTLDDWGVDVEFTASRRAAVHRYRVLHGHHQLHVLFDVRHVGDRGNFFGGQVEVQGSRRVVGLGHYKDSWSGGLGLAWGDHARYTAYFCAETNVDAVEWGTWDYIQVNPNKTQETGNGNLGAYLTFPISPLARINETVIENRVGISFISIEQACYNLENEVLHKSFEKVQAEGISEWERALSAIQVHNPIGTAQKGYGTEEGRWDQSKIFYSSLYRTMLMPVDKTGENARWQSGEPYWDDFYCLWDTFRTLHPLYTLIRPVEQSAIVRTLIDVYVHDGHLPDARIAGWNGITQVGNNAAVLLADAFVKKLPGIDWEKAYEALVNDAENEPKDFLYEGRGNLNWWKEMGYIPQDDMQAPLYHRSAARTVEYSYNDFCVAQVAIGLNKTEDYHKYMSRSDNWQNLWNSETESYGFTGFIIPRNFLSREFLTDHWADPTVCSPINFQNKICYYWDDEYYEASSWTYSFYTPQNVARLVQLCGGPDGFVERLNVYFSAGLFDPGNEPSFLVPYLYNYVGRNDRTADIIRQILSDHYNSTQMGLPGNDDAGAMASWYIFATLGFFPVAGQDLYLISPPQFERSTLFLDPQNNQKTFTIITHDLTPTAYIQSARLNGRKLQRNWFRHTEIMNGGTLELWMGETTSDWGSEKNTWPPSYVPKLERVSDIV